MALVSVVNDRIFSIPPFVIDGASVKTSITLDAAAEYIGTVGVLQLQAGASGSKTLSPGGGGSMVIRTGGTNTWANGSSTLTLGVVDALSGGLPTGGFDVSGTLAGGGAFPTSGYLAITMTAGTLSMTAGTQYCLMAELTARAGADSIQFRRVTSAFGIGTQLYPAYGYPYGVSSTGTPARNDIPPIIFIRFDDGTLGWIRGIELPLSGTLQTISFNSGSTPDEYCGVFTPTQTMQIDGFGSSLSSVASADDFSQILYEDPLGTPAALATVAVDGDVYSNINFADTLTSFAAVTLTAGVTYGVSVRPDTANNISLVYQDLTTGFNDLKKALQFGSTLKLAARTNGAGSFVETQTYHVPMFWLNVCGRQDGSGGASESAFTFVG